MGTEEPLAGNLTDDNPSSHEEGPRWRGYARRGLEKKKNEIAGHGRPRQRRQGSDSMLWQ
jgi:hypothetical protein